MFHTWRSVSNRSSMTVVDARVRCKSAVHHLIGSINWVTPSHRLFCSSSLREGSIICTKNSRDHLRCWIYAECRGQRRNISQESATEWCVKESRVDNLAEDQGSVIRRCIWNNVSWKWASIRRENVLLDHESKRDPNNEEGSDEEESPRDVVRWTLERKRTSVSSRSRHTWWSEEQLPILNHTKTSLSFNYFY